MKGIGATLAALLAAVFLAAPSNAQQLAPSVTTEQIGIVDTHAHPVRNLRRGGMSEAAILDGMTRYGIDLTILMSPPLPPGRRDGYGTRELAPLARRHPGRIAFAGGGDTLNPIIQQTTPGAVTPAVLAGFRKEAEAIVQSGAAGFGEIAVEHFSSGRGNHPYESSNPDHPLLLALADIAAREGMPIDLHMEAVPADMPFPEHRPAGRNPPSLRENISALGRLLAHNRRARIVWAHAGWDLTGERTVPLMRALLNGNPNLYMSVKIDEHGSRLTRPLAQDGSLLPAWLALLREFPDRFVIGSDQFHDESGARLGFARRFVDALPPEIARRIASENAREIYRLAPRGAGPTSRH